jgi:glycosyltransferase involved in cell wall biosynthesis
MTKDSKVVWIINQYAGSHKHGMTFRSYFLAKEFIKRHKVTIFSASFSHVMSNPPTVTQTFSKENIEGIEYQWLKVPIYNNSKSLGRVLSMFVFLYRLFFFKTKTLDSPDVIIVSSISPFPIWKAYFWSRHYKAKLIFEVRDIWPLTIIELGNFKKNNPFVFLLQITENFAYKVSDYVVSVLPNAFSHMKNHGLDKKRFVHIPNGIDLNMTLQKIKPEIASQIPKNKFIIAYTGAVGFANSLITFAKAANLLKDNNDIIFLIVGDGSEKEDILKYKLQNKLINLVLIDPIPKKNVIPLLKEYVDVCFIGLMSQPLFRFGISPNKMFDYLYSAKPIIQSIDSANDIVKEANAGISVKPENPKEIADAILKIFKMSEFERNELGKNGRAYVEKYHSYEQLAKQYEYLFN